METIIVHVGQQDIRAAVLEDDQLVEFYVEEPRNELVGNIYIGKVVNVLPGMQAAFIDIGIGKNAFLYVNDAVPHQDEKEMNLQIGEVLKEGQKIIVQVQKEPFGNKGPRVTTHISLPGRYIVYMPNSDYVGVSRRINNEEERERLKSVGEAVRTEGEGIIIRTVTLDANEEQIKRDFDFLKSLWKQALEKGENVNPPALIYKDLDLPSRLVRDIFSDTVKQFVVDNGAIYKKLKDMISITAPHLVDRIYMYSDKPHIFDEFNIQSEIEKVTKRKIWLKSGGYIIIDKTEALTSIDVNTGKFIGKSNLEDTVLKTNIEAAIEIAKQLRLRDIGGIIIIDFIDMYEAVNGQKVIETLEKEMKKDKTKSNILGFTQLGLVEMTRKKVRQSIDTILLKPCPLCEGVGRIIYEEELLNKIERDVLEFKEHSYIKRLIIEVHPYIVSYLSDKDDRVKRIEETFERPISFQSNEKLSIYKYDVKFEY